MEMQEILEKLKEMRGGAVTRGESERMVEALINIAQRLSHIDEDDMSRAELQIWSDLESIVE